MLSNEAIEKRKSALLKIDEAKFSRYHIRYAYLCQANCRAIMVAGVGFFTDAYDIFAVNYANLMVGYVYFPSGKLSSSQDTAIKISTSSGTVIGQLLFGFLADHLGRKKVIYWFN